MKRTPLPKRKTPLARGKPPKRKTPIKKKAPKRKKKSDLQRRIDSPYSKYWCNRADHLWSFLVRWRSQGYCERLGTYVGIGKYGVQAHHLVHRDRKMIRHSMNNGLALSRAAHKCNRGAPHGKDAWLFARWLMEHKPALWEYMEKNKWVTGRANYREAFDELLGQAKRMIAPKQEMLDRELVTEEELKTWKSVTAECTRRT